MSWVNKTITRDKRKSYDEVRGIQTKRGTLRYYLSIVTLAFGAILAYTSAHYVGAFISVNKAVALSGKSHTDSIAHTEVYRYVTKIIGEPNYKRVYLRKGQSIEAQYILPQGAQIDLEILQCKQRPILEVFSCKAISQSNSIIKGKRNGSHKIKVAYSGFYYFSAKVSPPELVDKYTTAGVNNDYSLIWRRV